MVLPVIAGMYLVAGALIVAFTREGRSTRRRRKPSPRRWLTVLSDHRLALFLPAWVAANAILGTWVAAQITFVLAGNRRVPDQRFVGALFGHEAWLSAVLAGYVLVFASCVIGWAFLVGRLPTRPVLFAGMTGSVIASAGLIAINHGVSPWLVGPLVLVGIFLEAGFAPAGPTYLAEVSGFFAADRGMVMGAYSVVLGLGYLAGNVLGGVFAQWLAFDGLALLTILLAALGLASIASRVVDERYTRRRTPRTSTGTPE